MSVKVGEIYKVNNEVVITLGYESVKKVRLYPLCDDMKSKDLRYSYFNACMNSFFDRPYEVNRELNSCRENILCEKNKLGYLQEDLVKNWYLKSSLITGETLQPIETKEYFVTKREKERIYDESKLVVGQVLIDLSSGLEKVYLGNSYYLNLYGYMMLMLRDTNMEKKLTKNILDLYHSPNKPVYRKNPNGILTDLVLDVEELRKELGIVV